MYVPPSPALLLPCPSTADRKCVPRARAPIWTHLGPDFPNTTRIVVSDATLGGLKAPGPRQPRAPRWTTHPGVIFRAVLPAFVLQLQIAVALNLTSIRDHIYQVQPCSGATKEGIQDGLAWVLKNMKKKKK